MSGFQGFTFTEPNAPPEGHATRSDHGETPIQASHEIQAQSNLAMQDLSASFQQCMRSSEDDSPDRQRFARSLFMPNQSKKLSDLQSVRRNKALELQRKRRQDRAATRRFALDNFSVSSDEENIEKDGHAGHSRSGPDEDDADMTDVSRSRRSKVPDVSKFANQVMYAEMLEEIPDDLFTHWSLLICPVGKRCLVTSGNGHTVARKRNGHVLQKCQTVFPNGSRQSQRSNHYSVFDCVYDPGKSTFYVLDVMSWRGCSIYDCETQMSWLQRIVDEHDPLTRENSSYRVEVVRPVPTTELSAILADPAQYVRRQGLYHEVDGLLFYHNEAHYVPGSTPLVCWVPLDRLATVFGTT